MWLHTGARCIQGRNGKAAGSRLRHHFSVCVLIIAIVYVLLMCWVAVGVFENSIPESWQMYSRAKKKLNMKLLEQKRARMPSCPSSEELQGDSQSDNAGNCSLPLVFMLRGRPPEELREDVLSSWAQFNPINLPARERSRDMVAVPGCEQSTWSNRLFAVYLEFFREILRDYPEAELFVFVEDDSLLLDADAFRLSVCAQKKQIGRAGAGRASDPFSPSTTSMGDQIMTRWRGGLAGGDMLFYSFFRAPDEEIPNYDCSYYYGTQAFLMNRGMLHHMLGLTAFNRCQTPIDLYLVRTSRHR